MVTGEGALIDSLPVWAQIAANLGVCLGLVAATGYTFWKKLSGAGLLIPEHHFEDGGLMHTLGETLQSIAHSLERTATAVESMHQIMQREDHDREVQREARRLAVEDSVLQGATRP